MDLRVRHPVFRCGRKPVHRFFIVVLLFPFDYNVDNERGTIAQDRVKEKL